MSAPYNSPLKVDDGAGLWWIKSRGMVCAPHSRKCRHQKSIVDARIHAGSSPQPKMVKKKSLFRFFSFLFYKAPHFSFFGLEPVLFLHHTTTPQACNPTMSHSTLRCVTNNSCTCGDQSPGRRELCVCCSESLARQNVSIFLTLYRPSDDVFHP